MKTVRLLHCADIHIGAAESFLGRLADERRFETLLTFERIMDIANEQGVKLVALAGDVFDSNNVEEKFISSFFKKISSLKNIKVVFAAGNHDPLNSQSPFLNKELPENLYVLKTVDSFFTFEDLGVRVYGRSFETSTMKGEDEFTLSTEKDYINILVQHGELKSDLSSDYNSITPKFVKNCNMDYIALGHIHQKTEIGRIGDTFFAYSGCPEGQGFDETDEKGVYVGDIGKGICDLKFVSTSKRKHICKEIDVTDFKDEKLLCEKIITILSEEYGEDYGENLYKLTLTGEVSPQNEPDLNQISARLSQLLYFVKLKNLSEYSLNLDALSEEKSLKGIFVKKMLEKIKADGDNIELKNALKIGLKAFGGEVKYDEN